MFLSLSARASMVEDFVDYDPHPLIPKKKYVANLLGLMRLLIFGFMVMFMLTVMWAVTIVLDLLLDCILTIRKLFVLTTMCLSKFLLIMASLMRLGLIGERFLIIKELLRGN